MKMGRGSGGSEGSEGSEGNGKKNPVKTQTQPKEYEEALEFHHIYFTRL